MTKKFWSNWQNRIGETKNIVTTKYGRNGWYLLNTLTNERIIKSTFHCDTVDLIIERHNTVLGKNGLHTHIENEYVTLHRNEIETIEFIKY